MKFVIKKKVICNNEMIGSYVKPKEFQQTDWYIILDFKMQAQIAKF